MAIYKQFKALVIDELETDKWEHPVHKHNHYEIIYIKTGSGSHFIDQNSIPYKKGLVFFIGPNEEHYFRIDTITRFVFIKFTDFYIHRETNSLNGLQYLEYLVKSRETHLSAFNVANQDRQIIDTIINVILSLKNDMLLNEHLIWLQILIMAEILQRNMPRLAPTLNRSKEMQAVFCYIHKYIYDPPKLKATVLASHFNISPDYIGPYFKRNTGITLRAYVSNYRKTLIQQRLKSGNYSLKQIAYEFGLTDESHVSKILKTL